MINKEDIKSTDIEILMSFIARGSSFAILTSPLYSSKIEYCVAIANNNNVFEADKFTRISMINPIYLDDEFNLLSKEKEEFIKLISENWNYIISESNDVLIREKESLIPINLPIPDYTKLPERI